MIDLPSQTMESFEASLEAVTGARQGWWRCPAVPVQSAVGSEPDTVEPRQLRKNRAALIRRVYEVGPLVCPPCIRTAETAFTFFEDQSRIVSGSKRTAGTWSLGWRTGIYLLREIFVGRRFDGATH